jgi:hypothetical protein
MSKQKIHNLTEDQISELFEDVYEIEEHSCDIDSDDVIWTPHPGSQTWFLTCPAYECLLSGPRGTGKTDVLIMDFAKDCGVGWGPSWRGLVLRQTYKQLADVVVKTRKWFPKIFPGIDFNKADLIWTWPTGETLMLSYMDNPSHYETYHGWEIPFISFEELSNWSTDECYELMKTCCRSSFSKKINGKKIPIPKRIRSTTNPWGKGHTWIKKHFVSAGRPLEIITNEYGRTKTWINSNVLENKTLHDADPDYLNTLKSIKDPNKRKAWLHGSWDIVSGGIIGDLWDENVHVLKPFRIPQEWRIDRAYDHGSSSPFTVGWFAESDGSEIDIGDGVYKYFPKGSLILIHEWYGWNGEDNTGLYMNSQDIALGIMKIEREYSLLKNHKVLPGPADNQIFNSEDGESIASRMARIRSGKSVISGVRWKRSNKNPGSRIIGLDLFRILLSESAKKDSDSPGFYVFDTCREGFLRCVPSIPRDEKNPDDAMKEGIEDHSWDMVRYRVLSRIHEAKIQEV